MLPLVATAVLSCSELTVTAIDVAQVRVQPATLALLVGDTARLAARVMDADGRELSGRPITWTTSEPDAATVTADGRLIALELGQVTVTASSEGVKGSAAVVISPAAIIDVHPDNVAFAANVGASAHPAPVELEVRNAGDAPLDGLTVAIAYSAGEPTGWLSASLDASTAPAKLTLSVDPGTLAIDTYNARVTITSEAARPTSLVVPVTLTVRDPPPTIELDEKSITFSSVEGGSSPSPQTVAVTNSGTGQLTGLGTSVTYTSGPGGWLTANLSPSTAPSTLTLNAATSALAAGHYTATVQIVSAVAENSPQVINVALDVLANPAQIEVSPAVLGFNAVAGGADPAARTFSIANTGGGTLDSLSVKVDYTNQPGNWLAAMLSTTTAPATVTLQPTTGQLAIGTYSATVSIFGRAANSPQTVAVSFVITPTVTAPTISVSPTSATFQAPAGGPDPGAQSVTITNSGGGTLNGLGVTVTYANSQPTGWLTASLNGTTAPTSLSLTAATGSLAAGVYSATVELTSPVASNSPRTIAVTFNVTSSTTPPAISLSPTSLDFYAVEGGNDPAIQSVSITNSGGGTLNNLTISGTYGPNQPINWLKGGLSSTTAPANMLLQPTTGSLQAGTYTATARVSSPAATNSPRTVAVTFYVVTSPFAPQPPTNLRTTVQGTDVRLDWNDNSSSELGFRIERATQWNGSWSTVGTVSAGTQTFTDNTATTGVTYYYRVVAVGLLGSSVSNIASATP